MTGNAAGLAEGWKKVTERLRAEVGEDLFSSWFARMEPELLAGSQIVVSVPTRFLRNWIEAHYAQKLSRACQAQFPDVRQVAIKVRQHAESRRAQTLLARKRQARSENLPVAVDGGGTISMVSCAPERGSPLDPAQVFETFVIGPSNALAHAAATRVACAQQGAPLSFNPLYIHSGAGLGKTHLLNAIAWQISRQAPERRVMFISAERFMYQFVAALKARDVITFKDRFQSIDVLLIDDFQFLQGRHIQQEFCHTFNSLVDAKRQVIIAADVPPVQLESIDQRMRSRLAGGLVVDIAVPELELRRSILRTRVERAVRQDPKLMIPDEVIEYIANRIAGGGRELEGALNRVIAAHQFAGAAITMERASLALRDLQDASEPVKIRIDDILKAVVRHYNVSRSDLLSPRRARSIVVPRQVGMYLAKRLTSRSLPEIGKRFGGRDHSTVLHAVRKIEETMANDEKLAREVNLLMRLIDQS